MSGRYISNPETKTDVVPNMASLGKGLKLLGKTTATFSRKKADEILGLAELVADRPLKPRHVDYLKRQIQGGTMRWEHVMIMTCVCLEDGKEYRMNGQHTSWARLDFDDSLPTPGVQFLRYEAATEADMRRLYASIDRGSPRTRRNVVDSYLLGTPEFGHHNIWSVRAVATALPYWLFETTHERGKHSPDDVSYWMLTDHLEVCQRVCSFLDTAYYGSTGANPGHNWLFRQPVTAALLATFSKSSTHKAVDEFWCAVRDGAGLDSVDDPRLRLRNALMNINSLFNITAGKSKTPADVADVIYDWCIRAWNAFRKGEELKQLKRALPEGGRRTVHR